MKIIEEHFLLNENGFLDQAHFQSSMSKYEDVTDWFQITKDNPIPMINTSLYSANY